MSGLCYPVWIAPTLSSTGKDRATEHARRSNVQVVWTIQFIQTSAKLLLFRGQKDWRQSNFARRLCQQFICHCYRSSPLPYRSIRTDHATGGLTPFPTRHHSPVLTAGCATGALETDRNPNRQNVLWLAVPMPKRRCGRTKRVSRRCLWRRDCAESELGDLSLG